MNTLRKSDRMMKLMAYADGELEGAEREEVEAWIAEDASSVRFANELAGLGELVQLGHKGSKDAKTIAAFDISDAIMSRVVEDKLETQRGVAKVAKDEAKEAKPAIAAVASLEAARARRNLKIGATVAAALALAASVFVMTRHKTEEPMARAPIQNVQPTPKPGTAVTEGTSGVSGADVDVEQTPGSSVSVFYVPGETNVSTSVVVWVDETGGK